MGVRVEVRGTGGRKVGTTGPVRRDLGSGRDPTSGGSESDERGEGYCEGRVGTRSMRSEVRRGRHVGGDTRFLLGTQSTSGVTEGFPEWCVTPFL